MKNTVVIIAIMMIASVASAQVRNTTLYSGDLTTEKYNEKLSILDAEILKLETKKATELASLEKEYKAEMPKAPKTKPVKKVKVEEKEKEYNLIDDLNSTEEETEEVISEVTTAGDQINEIKANYDADYKAKKEAIVAKYDGLIEKLNEQKLVVTEAMINSEGNYIASTTSAENAAYLYTSIKCADNMGAAGTSSVSLGDPNVQTRMLYIHNESNLTVEILSAPFAGIVLTPGQKSSVPFSVSTGNYALSYNEYRPNSSLVLNRTMNIAIPVTGSGTDINILNR